MKKFIKVFLCFAFPTVLYYILRFTWFEVYDNYGNYAFKDFIGPGHFVIYFIVCIAMVFSAIFLGLFLFSFLNRFSISEKHPIIAYIFDLLLCAGCLFVLGFSAVKLKWALYMPICMALAGPATYSLLKLFQAFMTLFGKIVGFFLKNTDGLISIEKEDSEPKKEKVKTSEGRKSTQLNISVRKLSDSAGEERYTIRKK